MGEVPAEEAAPAAAEEVAAPVEEVVVAEEEAAPEEEVAPVEAAPVEAAPAEKPKGISLPTTELTDDWMEDDVGSIDSEEAEEKVEEAVKEEPAASSDSEPEKVTASEEIFSLTEVSEKKEELVKEVSAEEIMAMKVATEDS